MPSVFTIFLYCFWMKRVLFLSGLALLVLGEVYLRLPFIPQRLESMPDEELGGIVAPSQRGYDWLGNFSVQSVPITVNSDGHRGRDTDWSGPVLLAVGDSQGWGTGVADDEVYTAVLETWLREQPGQSEVQVVNASGPGFMSTAASTATQFTPAVGQKMWADNKAHWEGMASLASAKGIPAVFFLYDPQAERALRPDPLADQASGALWERMKDLPARYPN